MSADIHRLGMGEGDAQAGGAVPLSAERSVYLDAYLAPFRRWLERDTVTEIMVNRPGEVWIEDASNPGMQRIETPEIDDRLVQRLAEQVLHRLDHAVRNRGGDQVPGADRQQVQRHDEALHAELCHRLGREA